MWQLDEVIWASLTSDGDAPSGCLITFLLLSFPRSILARLVGLHIWFDDMLNYTIYSRFNLRFLVLGSINVWTRLNPSNTFNGASSCNSIIDLAHCRGVWKLFIGGDLYSWSLKAITIGDLCTNSAMLSLASALHFYPSFSPILSCFIFICPHSILDHLTSHTKHKLISFQG